MAGRISYLGGIVRDGLVLDLDAGKKDSYNRLGTSWNDVSGNQNNGTLVNGPTFNTSNGGSIFFDGSNEYINCGTNNTLKITGALSLNCWIKSVSTNGAFISKSISIFGGANQKVYELGVFSNTTYFQFGNGTFNSSLSTSAAPILNNQWHYVVGVWDGTTNSNGISIYYDGVLINQNTSLVSSIQQTNDVLQIGYGNGFPYTGNISLVHIYNKALTASEVLQNYNATKGRYL